ncbi:MAG: hypothetical protein O2U62_00075 [Candidatus Bathyarchaeota archaeon]|nr:hypothetical protein [Candidatus Bathyarchaeota archaeon]
MTCDKAEVLKFYEHLLGVVEKLRMSEHFSELCELESEYISLFGGEEAFGLMFYSEFHPEETNEQ